jgi:hypothetical protein
MQEVLNWTIDTIRQQETIDSTWLEEKKFEWAPLVVKTLKSIIEKQYTLLIVTDDDRSWFGDYILNELNHKKNGRPNIPVFDFKGIYHHYDKVKSEEDIQLIDDMLDISFPNGYVFWYIGKGNSHYSVIPKYHQNSFLWLIDEDLSGSLSLKAADQNLDLKLLQIFKLFNKTLDAALFVEITLD